MAAAGTAQAAAKPAEVVRAWSHALNANDNEHAARLFAHNARVVQPGVDVLLNSHALAVAFNASLPCAGTSRRGEREGQPGDGDVRPGRAPEASLRRPGREGGGPLRRPPRQDRPLAAVPVPPPEKPTAYVRTCETIAVTKRDALP